MDACLDGKYTLSVVIDSQFFLNQRLACAYLPGALVDVQGSALRHGLVDFGHLVQFDLEGHLPAHVAVYLDPFEDGQFTGGTDHLGCFLLEAGDVEDVLAGGDHGRPVGVADVALGVLVLVFPPLDVESQQHVRLPLLAAPQLPDHEHHHHYRQHCCDDCQGDCEAGGGCFLLGLLTGVVGVAGGLIEGVAATTAAVTLLLIEFEVGPEATVARPDEPFALLEVALGELGVGEAVEELELAAGVGGGVGGVVAL